MPKNKKGKQKQVEHAIKNNLTQPSTAEQADDTLNVNNFAEAQGDAWGAPASDAWGTSPAAESQGETWGETWQDTESWDTAEALLQPPSTHLRSDLSTVLEQPSSEDFVQNRARLSEIEESPDEYDHDHSWHNSESNSVHHSESRTITAAAPSFTGSPTAQPVQSTTVLQEAMKAILTQGKSTASEAARKMEKVKAVQFHMEPVITPQVEKSDPQFAPQGRSSASAAAAVAESSRKPTPASNPGQKASNSKTIPWTYPKPFKPGARDPAPLPVDPSWISTGRNAWSNKPRNGFQNSICTPGNQYLHTQHLPQHPFQQPQFQQHAQHTQQPRQSHYFQQSQAHQKHQSHPQTHHSQSVRPLYKVQTKERQDWQDWGKEQGGESTGTESDGTTTEWETFEDDQWGRGGQVWGQNQNATGGEWGWGGGGRNQHAAGGWGQNAGKGRGHTGGGWDQGTAEERGGQDISETWDQNAGGWAQEPANPKKDNRTRKSRTKKGDNEWGQGPETSGQKGQKQQDNAWGGAWGQESTQRQTQDAWGQHTNHQGGQGGDAWGQGGGDAWGQDTNHRSGQGNDARGQSNGAWGQDTNHRSSKGGNVDQANHRSGQGDDAWSQGASTWGQESGNNRKIAGDWAAVGTSSHTAWTAGTSSHTAWTAGASSHTAWTAGASSHTAWTAGASLHIAWDDEAQALPKVTTAAASEVVGDTDGSRQVRFSPKASELWGASPRGIHSKTLARSQGVMTTLVNDPNNVRFLESKGAAFEFVTNAFFENSRLARERIHWLFPFDKDPRVVDMLAWVQKLSYDLGTFGVTKFLQSGERGGLFINAIFQMCHSPKEPALDWLTFDELQSTMDKTLQESVTLYNPSTQVMVFVYLPSESGNSIAIWRLEINVPDETKSKYHAEINTMIKGLRKHTEYIFCVDEFS